LTLTEIFIVKCGEGLQQKPIIAGREQKKSASPALKNNKHNPPGVG